MSPEVTLLLLRIAIALALYAFVGGLFYYLRREVWLASQQLEENSQAQGRLVVVDCGEDVPIEVGRQYRLQPVTILGRGPTCTVSLQDSFVSTEHARIQARRGQWWLDDLDSRNGTTLNGVPLTSSVVLSSGDVIGIGRIEFRFEAG